MLFSPLQMRNNHDNIHIFISQSLGFLHHAQTEIRNGAARFMGKYQEMLFPPLNHSLFPSPFPLSFCGGRRPTEGLPDRQRNGSQGRDGTGRGRAQGELNQDHFPKGGKAAFERLLEGKARGRWGGQSGHVAANKAHVGSGSVGGRVGISLSVDCPTLTQEACGKAQANLSQSPHPIPRMTGLKKRDQPL